RAPRSTPFPYTTLFRSDVGPGGKPGQLGQRRDAVARRPGDPRDLGAERFEPLLDPFPDTAVPHQQDLLAFEAVGSHVVPRMLRLDRKSTRLNSSHVSIS